MSMNMTIGQVMEKLAAGETVNIKGFGKFSVKYQKAKTVRNPLTGESKEQDAKMIPHFAFAFPFKEKVKQLPVTEPEKK